MPESIEPVFLYKGYYRGQLLNFVLKRVRFRPRRWRLENSLLAVTYLQR